MADLATPTPRAAGLWAALTLLGLVAAFFIAFVVAVSLISRLLRPNLDVGSLRLDLAGFLVLLGVLGMSAVLVAGRVAFGRWLEARPAGLAVPIVGVAIASALEVALHAWAHQTMGYYDSDFIGWTAGLSFMVVLVAIGRFGVSVAPRGATTPPRVGLAVGAVLVVLIVLSNLPGLGDGIGPNSWPLAILVAAAALFAIIAVVGGLRPRSAG